MACHANAVHKKCAPKQTGATVTSSTAIPFCMALNSVAESGCVGVVGCGVRGCGETSLWF
jgi:hypothetical protein